jgi:hypothetical protein
MNQQMFPVFLGLMVVSSLAWFFLSKRFYNLLQSRYPEIYESLGRPKFLFRNSVRTNISTMAFLLGDKKKQQVKDPDLRRLCTGLLQVLFIYFISLLGCIALIVGQFI